MIREPKIFSDGYQLSVMVFNRTRAFPKHFRPTLARRLEEASLDLMLTLKIASFSREAKESHLSQASERLDEIRVLLQLSHDMHLLNPAGFAEMSAQTALVGKQIGGLSKALRKGQAGGGVPVVTP